MLSSKTWNRSAPTAIVTLYGRQAGFEEPGTPQAFAVRVSKDTMVASIRLGKERRAVTMIRGLAEVVLSVHDLAASLRFYRDTLGLTLVSEPEFRPVFLRAGDPAVTVPQLVVLVPLPPDTPPFPATKPGRTLHHLAFELAPADFDRMRDHLSTQGFAIRTSQHPVIPSRTIYVDDPDGNEVEFIAGD